MMRPGLNFIESSAGSAVEADAVEAGARYFMISTAGAQHQVAFFDAVRRALPLNPPIHGNGSWDALLDSLREGIYELNEPLVLLLWTGAADLASADPKGYQNALSVLTAVSEDLADPEYAEERLTRLCCYIA
jgi:hypothetical protein